MVEGEQSTNELITLSILFLAVSHLGIVWACYRLTVKPSVDWYVRFKNYFWFAHHRSSNVDSLQFSTLQVPCLRLFVTFNLLWFSSSLHSLSLRGSATDLERTPLAMHNNAANAAWHFPWPPPGFGRE